MAFCVVMVFPRHMSVDVFHCNVLNRENCFLINSATFFLPKLFHILELFEGNTVYGFVF